MAPTEDPIARAMPHAGALAVAVADRSKAGVEQVLRDLTREDLYALAIVLAASVDPDSTLLRPLVPMSEASVVEHAVTEVAQRYHVEVEAIFSASRDRAVGEARQVAMAACRLAGLSSPAIGKAFGRDHSTVLYAATRVGESPKLQRIARAVAEPLAPARGLLGDEQEPAA